ncbi:MAG: ribosome biogenesis GTPase Der [Dehalococcoidales bacterium]
MSKTLVAIVGRQNVGKSTLLNRVAGKRLAIVEDLPGTTRDRVFAGVSWRGSEFTLVDTGGLEPGTQSVMSLDVEEQVAVAIDEADVIIFLVDVKSGVIPSDFEVGDMLRRVTKPVILVANKADNSRLEAMAVEFYQLGLGEPMVISAHHGLGTTELLDRVVSLLPPTSPAEAESGILKIAIVGRPNVGKSMLLNALVGEKRSIVHEVPGTTRDAVDTLFEFDGHEMLLIDTAGIRRRGRLGRGIEFYSVIRSLRAIDRADVVLLVMDAGELVTAQDMHVSGYIQQAVKGVILVVNKWDLVTEKNQDEWNTAIRAQFRFMAYAPVLYLSAKFGQGVEQILPQASRIYQERQKRLPTAQVNNVIQQAIAGHNLPRIGRKRLKILYVTQTEVSPPTFVFFVNDAKIIHFSYQRFLENKLREAFGFAGTPIRLTFKSRGES